MPQHDTVTLIKEFTYRGSLEEWSNSYSLTGTTPTSPTEWKALFDAIAASEKKCYMSLTKVVRALGYKATEDHADYSWDYKGAGASIAGILTMATGEALWAGDQAGWLRCRTGSSANGKPKYVRKYFHGGCTQVNVPDVLSPNTVTAYLAHGTTMIGGTLPGGMVWCGPGGTVGVSPAASPYVTTRTLKRRSKRPTLPQ